MNIFIASVIFVTAGSPVASLGIDAMEIFPTREALIVEAQCPSKCQGDFPAPSNRKYAESGARLDQSGIARG